MTESDSTVVRDRFSESDLNPLLEFDHDSGVLDVLATLGNARDLQALLHTFYAVEHMHDDGDATAPGMFQIEGVIRATLGRLSAELQKQRYRAAASKIGSAS